MADQIREDRTDEDIMGDDEADDGLMPDRMDISPSGLKAGGSRIASDGSREAANDPGSLVTEAVVNRLKDAANLNNDIDPRDLIEDIMELPSDVRDVFPFEFVSALYTISETGGAKGSDEDPGMRKEAMKKLMAKYGGQLDAIAAEDERRVSNYIATIDPLNYPTTQSNEVVELLNFLNHPGSFADGDRPEPGMIQSKSLGSAGNSFLNAGLSTLDDGSPFGEIDEVLESVVEDARDSLIIDSAPTAVASIDEYIDEDPDATRKFEEATRSKYDDDDMKGRQQGLTIAQSASRFDPNSFESRSLANLNMMRTIFGGSVDGDPLFMPRETPEVKGTTTASAPAPTVDAGSRMAAVMPEPRAADDSAVAVNTLGDEPDADLGRKPGAPPSREEQFRQGGVDSYDSAMAFKKAAETKPKTEPKTEPKPRFQPSDISFASVADEIAVEEPARFRKYEELTDDELQVWGRRYGAHLKNAVKRGGQNFDRTADQVYKDVEALGLSPEFASQAINDIYYSTDLGQRDPEYKEYLAKQEQTPDSSKTKLAGGLKVPEEGNPEPIPEISDDRNEENMRIMAQGGDSDTLMSRAVPPTDPDEAGDLVITSMYGIRDGRRHKGIDLRARKMDGNTNVYSVMDGQISAIEKNPSGESGRYVFVNHNDGLQTRYFHGESIPEGLRVGMPVSAGDMIMVAGQSGRSKGPHLHFEIGKLNDREFVQMDPMTALPNVFENYVLSDDLSLMKASTF